MKAPDKLYISKIIYGTFQYQVPDPDDKTIVEYIRTEAFIEKIEKYLKDRLLGYIDYCKHGVGVSTEEFINDFKNYIKENKL